MYLSVILSIHTYIYTYMIYSHVQKENQQTWGWVGKEYLPKQAGCLEAAITALDFLWGAIAC